MRVWQALIAGGGLVSLGCDRPEAALAPPALDPASASAQALADYDANKDSQLDSAELEKCPGLKAGLSRLDKNGDGKLSGDEVAARLQQYVDAKIAQSSVTCYVAMDGQPVSGATVSLIPEKFMGGAVRPATGTTRENGSCELRIENEELPGVNSGIYKIEVSLKKGGLEQIPAKFNSATTLGEDIGRGSPVMEDGLRLKLSRK